MKPMKSGVDSSTCFLGGAFHEGMGGMSEGDLAFAARGKLSTIGGGDSGGGLCRGLGFSVGVVGVRETLLYAPEWMMRTVEMTRKGMIRRQRLRRNVPCDNILSYAGCLCKQPAARISG